MALLASYIPTVNESETITAAQPVYGVHGRTGGFPAAPARHIERS